MSLKKIAERTGVSVSTVSRVLNDPNHRCASADIRDRILKAAMELNYSPNETARSLRRGEDESGDAHQRVHVLMTRTDEKSQDPFFHELMTCVEAEVYRLGARLERRMFLPDFSDEERMRQKDAERMLTEACRNAHTEQAGLVVIGKCEKQVLSVLKSRYRAVVALNRNSTNYQVDEILCDGKKVASLATNYLIGLGHRQIAYVGSCRQESRYRGFIDTLRRKELEPDPRFLIETDQTEQTGYQAMERLLAMPFRPSAIYCANDITAIGMLRCLDERHEKTYRPAIVASDDIEEAQEVSPMLTTVQVPAGEMGKFAVMILMDRLRGGHRSAVRLELEGRLMIRESCRGIAGKM